MHRTLRIQIQKYQNILLFLAFAGLAYILVTIIVREKLDDVHTIIEIQITKQQTLLTAIAETTARNGADTVTEAIVRDCDINERTEFDTLLVQLDKGPSLPQLTRLDRLFGRCATFYPQRKSVMVSRLSREVEVYASYVDQLKAVSTKEIVASYNVSKWQELVVQEKKQSELFAKLVTQQEKIIAALMTGKSPQSEEIKSVLKSVQETQTTLVQTNQEATSIRKTLVPL